ncbi:MAG: invasion associated locus B family protein [Acetobacteraceae bacterium]
MRPLPILFASLAVLAAAPLSAPVWAQSRASHAPHAAVRAGSTGPKRIGKFDDWQAATHLEAGQPACYAFTRPTSSAPALPGRGDVVLTVTERQGGRDTVALSAGFAYPASAEVQVAADGATLVFYTSNRSAFAKDGHATVVAFGKARQALAHSPGPRQAAVTDTFSLRGFAQAYAAINKACPLR